MSIREQLRGVIRRSRDMADVAGVGDDDDDDSEYGVLDAERRVGAATGAAIVSPTGRTLQDLMKEQQSHMRLAEERHRQEYLPMLDDAIRAVGGDPNAHSPSGGSGAASYGRRPSAGTSPRGQSPSLRQVLAGEAQLPETNGGSTTPKSPANRINPILNRSPSQSPEATSLGMMLMRPNTTLSMLSADTEAPAEVGNSYTHANTSSSVLQRGGGSAAPTSAQTVTWSMRAGGGDATRSPSPNASSATATASRQPSTVSAHQSPTVSHRSGTPPPPKLLTTTPPPTPKGSFYKSKGPGVGLGSPLGKAGGSGVGISNSNSNGLGVDALDGTLLSAASTGGGPPEDFESTQRPSGGAGCGAGKGLGGAPSRPSANACSAADAALKVVPKSPTQPTPPSIGQSSTTRSPRASVGAGLISASPPSSAAAAAAHSPPLPRMGSNVSGGYRSGGSSPRPTGGVMRPATGSSSASVGGAGPAMSLKEMMSDRNKDLSDAERRRAEEYVPLRDAAFREIERLEAEGKWKKM